MKILISESLKEPLYRQIFNQIKSQIHRGELVSHTALPSIRYLAKELSVSVITIKKAYQLLESEKSIYSIPGKGFYISPYKLADVENDNHKFIKEKLIKLRHEAVARGLSEDIFLKIIEEYKKELK